MRPSSITTDEQFYLTLSTVATRIDRAVDNTLARHNLTSSEYALLRIIQRTPGVTAADARKRLRIAGPSISELIVKLVRKHFVERTADRSDARIKRLTLTAAGNRTVRKARAGVESFVHALEISDAQLLSLTKSLQSLLPSLSRYA